MHSSYIFEVSLDILWFDGLKLLHVQQFIYIEVASLNLPWPHNPKYSVGQGRKKYDVKDANSIFLWNNLSWIIEVDSIRNWYFLYFLKKIFEVDYDTGNRSIIFASFFSKAYILIDRSLICSDNFPNNDDIWIEFLSRKELNHLILID